MNHCLNCGKECKKKFCSQECYKDYFFNNKEYKEAFINKIKQGMYDNKTRNRTFQKHRNE